MVNHRILDGWVDIQDQLKNRNQLRHFFDETEHLQNEYTGGGSVEPIYRKKVLRVDPFSDRSFISAFKYLGGINIQFSLGGLTHPVDFLKKLEIISEDAGVHQNMKRSILR